MSVALEMGSRKEHLETLVRANRNNVSYVWSGAIRLSSYLRENLQFAIDEGIIKATPTEEAQESGWTIEWLRDPSQLLEAQDADS